ncbi:MAG: hypothetical protein K0S01_308 [Herbinix sp.]|jgi:GNAT superfamily N-acetyltransferase|nr:hypothetical protein [Herbinix sp.]
MEMESFLRIKERLDKYTYTSMRYVEFDEISQYKILYDNEQVILIYGYNVESRHYEYHWASSKVEDLLDVIDRKKENTLITFIPREWVDRLNQAGFNIFAVWNDYHNTDINSLEYFNLPEPQPLSENECEVASQITFSCSGQSRGFTGQTTEWMKKWIQGAEPAAIETGAKNCTAFVHRINGKIVGVICTAIYAYESDKGPVAWVREVAVHPSFQRQGIAKELIMQALYYGKKHSAVRAFLMADECNEHAIHLYEKLGFKANKEDIQIDMVFSLQ